MSPARALPWALLALSLAAHAWLHSRRATPEPTLSDHKSYPSPKPHPSYSAPSPPAPLSAPPPALAPAASPAATPSIPQQLTAFRTYATLAASTQATAEQHDDLARVLSRWIATDPVGAAEWVAAQTAAHDGPRLDPALAQLSNHLVAQGRFDAARAWTDSIRTPEVRLDATEEILAEQFRARQLDAPALQATATQAGLPADRVRAILDYSRLD